MKKLLAVLVVFGPGAALAWLYDGTPPTAEAGGGQGGGVEKCAAKSGDADADGNVNLTDAVTILNFLFKGEPTVLVPLCAAPPAPSDLPDTGQTKCYGADGTEIPCDSAVCAGQDGFYAKGCPSRGRFSDNGDGTVTDHCTGLMWQKDTADVNGDGQLSEQINGGDLVRWCDALAYCEKLSFAGHDDWRLPNVRELQSIVDYRRARPSIDPVFGAFSYSYWSSTSNADEPFYVWLVRFVADRAAEVEGLRELDARFGDYYVRAVRAEAGGGQGGGVEKCAAKNGDANADGNVNLTDAVTILNFLFKGEPTVLVPLCAAPLAPSGLPDTGQTKCYRAEGTITKIPCGIATCRGQDGFYATGCPPEGRFSDNGDGTVTDRCTGLMWQKDTADVNRDGQSTDQDLVRWCEALAICENLSFAGHDDWRLPNVRELQSIVDYGRARPSIDPVFSDPVFRAIFGRYWSSSSLAGIPNVAWLVEFIGGGVFYFDKSSFYYVRAVRGGGGGGGGVGGPTLALICPSRGSVHGGDLVTLTGANFQAGTRVHFGDALGLGPAISDEGTTVTVRTPPAKKPGGVDVTIAVPGEDALVAKLAFTYLAGPLQLSVSEMDDLHLGSSPFSISRFGPVKFIVGFDGAAVEVFHPAPGGNLVGEGFFQVLSDGPISNIRVGDLSGDGHQDAAVILSGGAKVFLLIQNDKKGFDATALDFHGDAADLAVANFDGKDGPEVIVADRENQRVIVYSQGATSFTATFEQHTTGRPCTLTACQLDGDSAREIVVGCLPGPELVLLDPGDNKVRVVEQSVAGLTGICLLRNGRFRGTDRDDLAAQVVEDGPNDALGKPPRALRFLSFSPEGKGHLMPSFELDSETRFASSSDPAEILVKDLDLDGDPDLIFFDGSSGSVVLLENLLIHGPESPDDCSALLHDAVPNPSFHFSEKHLSVFLGPGIQAIAPVDTNGDGFPDILASHSKELKGLRILMNRTSSGN
jgi:hypothetical protein